MSAFAVIIFIVICVVATLKPIRRARAGVKDPNNQKSGSISAHQYPVIDVYLTSADIHEMVRFWQAADPTSQTSDTKATQRHPGWSTIKAFNELLREKVVSVDPLGIVKCEGVWLRPSGAVIVVPVDADPNETLGKVLQTEEGGRRASHVYLSRQDVLDLEHHSFYIAINHGYNVRHVEDRYPGWSWEELHGALKKSNLMHRRSQQEPSPRHLPDGYVGVLISRSGEVVLDDGSLIHPAKELSWQRQGIWRLSEHCVIRGYQKWSSVIVHAPHTSTHIPNSIRAELLLDDVEVSKELEAITDGGVLKTIDHLLAEKAPTIVTASMSRLVFDPERFPENDEMEQTGMGLVYTKCSNGRQLREIPAPSRLNWYRNQHQAYTESLERVVDGALRSAGAAIIIDLHSYPKEPQHHEDSSRPRPEICIGTDPYHTPDWLKDLVLEIFNPEFEVIINTPYSGAYVPGKFYKTNPKVVSVMIEVRRDVLEPRTKEVASLITMLYNMALVKISKTRA